MKAIRFAKHDEQGLFRYANISAPKYTAHGAVDHLRANGFSPMSSTGRKLPRCWTNGTYNAYII